MNDHSWIADGVKCNFLNANGDTIKNIRDYDLHAEFKNAIDRFVFFSRLLIKW